MKQVTGVVLLAAGVLIGVAGMAALGGRTQAADPEAASAPRDGVLIHIRSDPRDAQAVLMALRMAEVMSGDHDVLVYCDLKGVELLIRGAEDVKLEPFQSSEAAIKDLLGKGVTIMACPSCLKAAGRTQDELVEGVEIARKDALFGFTKGRILTLDY